MFSKYINYLATIHKPTIMKQIQILFVLFLFIVFLAGLYFSMFYKKPCGCHNKTESMENKDQNPNAESSCPNMLVKKGNVLMLYNTNQPIVEGTNPIPFFNLDEYINYLEIQRRKGIQCPVLYLQQENNAQGEDVYRMRPSPFELQAGLPTSSSISEAVQIVDANRANPPYNANNYAGFDPQGQYVGVYTNLDKMHDSTQANKISDNPMDPNWAGIEYTQQMVDSGKYEENNITTPVLFTPKTAFYPTITGPFAPPKDIL